LARDSRRLPITSLFAGPIDLEIQLFGQTLPKAFETAGVWRGNRVKMHGTVVQRMVQLHRNKEDAVPCDRTKSGWAYLVPVHPIQYQAPVLLRFAAVKRNGPSISRLLFLQRVYQYAELPRDEGFWQQTLKWDVPACLDGYRYEFLSRAGGRPDRRPLFLEAPLNFGKSTTPSTDANGFDVLWVTWGWGYGEPSVRPYTRAAAYGPEK